MSSTRNWGVHGHAIKHHKDMLEAALVHVPADNTRCRGYIDRILGICEEHLTTKEVRGEDLLEEWRQDGVEKWIRGLLLNHPELAEFGVRV